MRFSARQRKTDLKEKFRSAEVEAAGIEPASREVSIVTSTCVVDCLNFARSTVNRQTENRTRRKLYLTTRVSDVTCGDPELTTDFQASLAKALNPGSVVTLPMQSFRLQLRFLIRFLRGPLINHDTQPILPASGRIQFAPD